MHHKLEKAIKRTVKTVTRRSRGQATERKIRIKG
jgi:hypothetical protein